MDLRVWEWGLFRRSTLGNVNMLLDTEFKMISFPENKVLFDTRLDSKEEKKKGQSLQKMCSEEGDVTIRESQEASNVVSAKFRDFLLE